MKTHPIIFSTPMVQAIIEGRKTMTRRICKHEGAIKYVSLLVMPKETKWLNCPYGYEIGDVLWVRESWTNNGRDYFRYKADGTKPFINSSVPEKFRNKWKPSIHMPKTACRIWLEVISIRVERLMDITEEDAKKEGVYPASSDDCPPECSHRFSFYKIWNSIHGKKTSGSRLPSSDFSSNPWVWVIEFKRIEKPANTEL